MSGQTGPGAAFNYPVEKRRTRGADESCVAKEAIAIQDKQSGNLGPITIPALNACYTLPAISGRPGTSIDDTWVPTSTTNAPDARFAWNAGD